MFFHNSFLTQGNRAGTKKAIFQRNATVEKVLLLANTWYMKKHFKGFALIFSALHKKMKFFIKGFFSKCDQIHSFLGIWSHSLKESLKENFIFCAVLVTLTFFYERSTQGSSNLNPAIQYLLRYKYFRLCYFHSWSLLNKVTQAFSCEFCEIFNSTCFTEHLRWLLLSNTDLSIKLLIYQNFGCVLHELLIDKLNSYRFDIKSLNFILANFSNPKQKNKDKLQF